MTALIAALSVAVSVVLGGWFVHVGRTVVTRAEAQAAADAAALAAVAESAPYGAARHQSVARSYAEANGAELVECRCEPGSTAVQVEVEIEGIAARARATIDPDLYRPASMTFDEGRLHPALAGAVRRLVAASGGTVRVVSGWRSPLEQARLWSEALRRYGSAEAADDWVAPPGASMHERGLAVDLGGDISLAVRLVDELRLPLHRPLSNEPWHFELVGTRR